MKTKGDWYHYLESKGLIETSYQDFYLSDDKTIPEVMTILHIQSSVWRDEFFNFFGIQYLPEFFVVPHSDENFQMLEKYGYVKVNDTYCYIYFEVNYKEDSYFVERQVLENSWQIKALSTLNDLHYEQHDTKEKIKLKKCEAYRTIGDFVDTLLFYAIQKRATDIHLDIEDDSYFVRLRIDGEIKLLWKLPKHLHSLTINRLKIISGMDVVERRRPQDGHLVAYLDESEYHFRLATLGMLDYEKMVIRILPQQIRFKNLGELGLLETQLRQLLRITKQKQGLILITGPTNSGKSTLLYSLLREHVRENKSIFTIEDPVEVEVPALYQVEVNQKINLDFTTGLRGILRQDPDIIAIGEIRDEKTLDIALKAALTGHLVYATLHTTSALDAILRLVNMGADRVILGSVLKYVVNQRLVRKLCHHDNENSLFCSKCHGSGYHDRIAIFETWRVSSKAKEAILSGEMLASHLTNVISNEEFFSLKDAAKIKIDQKLTTLEEVSQYI